MNHLNKTRDFIWKTFINGIVFLIPVVALIWIFSEAIGGIASIFSELQNNSMIKTLGGPFFLSLLALLFLLAFIFLIGLLVHFTFLRNFNSWLERQVLGLIPGYDFLKSTMEEKLNIKSNKGKVVLVKWDQSQQLGIQVDEHPDGTCTVFFPYSSLTGGGEVHIVSKNRVAVLGMPLSELEETFYRFGKGLGKYLNQ